MLRGFGPIGFMASFVSCDETSVHICARTTVESTGCIHVSRVLGAAQAVYSLRCHQSGTGPVSAPASLVPLSSSVHVLQGPCGETAV